MRVFKSEKTLQSLASSTLLELERRHPVALRAVITRPTLDGPFSSPLKKVLRRSLHWLLMSLYAAVNLTSRNYFSTFGSRPFGAKRTFNKESVGYVRPPGCFLLG